MKNSKAPMLTRFLLLALGFLVASAAPGLAALGDSEDKVAELYGKTTNAGFPDKKGISTNLYKHGDYMVLVQFFLRSSVAESYTRSDNRDFSEKEISSFLEASGKGLKWNKAPDKQAWERSDHKARAWLESVRGRPTLLVQVH